MTKFLSIRSRKLIAAVVALPVLVAATIISGISPASAWHPEIQGTANCQGVVSFSVTSWNSGVQGQNTAIRVEYSLDGTTFVKVAPEVNGKITSANGVNYEFTAANSNKFNDTFKLTAPWSSKITLKATSIGVWGGNHNEVSSRTVEITLPAPCAEPTAIVTGPDCKSTDAVVKLNNTGGQSVKFTIYKGTSTEPFKSVTVNAKSSESVKVAIDAATKLTVSALGMNDVTKDVAPEADCSKPIVKVNQACIEDGSGWNVHLDNQGKLSEVFNVVITSKSGTVIKTENVTLESGRDSTKAYTFKDLGIVFNDSAKLVVTVDGKVVGSSEATNDCLQVSADVAQDCAKGGAVITLTNKGKLSESFAVTRDGRALEGSPVVVAGGKSEQRLLQLNEDEKATIVVTGAASKFSVTKVIVQDCAQVQSTTTTSTTSTTVAPPTTTSVPAEVMGEQITRPQLAATGISDVRPMIFFGGLLLMLGLSMLRFGRTLSARR